MYIFRATAFLVDSIVSFFFKKSLFFAREYGLVLKIWKITGEKLQPDNAPKDSNWG
jgi:hypothetical protein